MTAAAAAATAVAAVAVAVASVAIAAVVAAAAVAMVAVVTVAVVTVAAELGLPEQERSCLRYVRFQRVSLRFFLAFAFNFDLYPTR